MVLSLSFSLSRFCFLYAGQRQHSFHFLITSLSYVGRLVFEVHLDNNFPELFAG